MASFCTKCGTALAPDTQFCTSCGASVAGTAAAPVAPTANPYAPPSYPSEYPPSCPQAGSVYPGDGSGAGSGKSGTSALKVILIVVAIFIGLGLIGAGIFAFTIWRVARAVQVDSNGDKVTLHTPGGTITTNSGDGSYTAGDLGADIYPGAKAGKGSMKMDLPTGSIVTGVFETSDSKSQVVEFYKSRFGSGVAVMDTPETAILTLKKGDHESVMVTVSSKSNENDGLTRVAIMHTKSSK